MKSTPQIRSVNKPKCICCGGQGELLYPGQKDRLFGAPGDWNIVRCPTSGCGLMWLNPSPLDEDVHLAYESYYTHANAPRAITSLMSRIVMAYQELKFNYKVNQSTPIARLLGRLLSFLPFFREHMDYPFAYLKDARRGKLLELGAGSGETLKKFVDWGWDAEGLDFDPKAVNACAKIGLRVREGDIFSQSFDDRTFDAMFSSHVLEHVPDPLALMKESIRVLKEGSVFVAVTPNGNSALHGLFKSNWRGLEPPRHLNIFTVNALTSLAKDAGFTRVNVATSNFSAAGVFYHSAHLATGFKKGLVLRLFANLIRFVLTLYHRIFKMSGEELILIAYR